MNTSRLFLGIILTILLVVSVSVNGMNITTAYSSTNIFTTPNASAITTTNNPTTAPVTTARATTEQPVTTNAPLTTSSTGYPPSNATTAPTTSSTSTKAVSPTTPASGRRFDGLSFIGGMILAAGLSGLIFLVVSYLRRSNRLPYSNLQ